MNVRNYTAKDKAKAVGDTGGAMDKARRLC